MNEEELSEFLIHVKEEFHKMYESSESRIDRTNEMVCKLAEAVHDLVLESKNTSQMYVAAMQSYDKHLDKLQERCTMMQKLFDDCQQLNFKLTEAIAQQEKTMQKLLDGFSRVNINNYKLDKE